jgi:hypothetical protein
MISLSRRRGGGPTYQVAATRDGKAGPARRVRLSPWPTNLEQL